MPAGAVEDHDEMRLRRSRCGDMACIAAVSTLGSTGVASSPVAGRIAVKM